MEEVGYTGSAEEYRIRREFELRWLGVSIELPVKENE